MAEPRIIIFDLETLPHLKEAMKVWCQLSNYPGLTLKATITTIICAGWKVLGQKRTNCINAWDFSNWKKDINDDREVCKALYKVLKDADAIVTHNGKRFDLKHFQTRLLYHNLGVLPKIHHIDTCAEAKRYLYAFNNRLNTLATTFLDETKLENGGWQLWVDVMERKPAAQRLMTRYCKQDVNVTEKLYQKLRPLVSSIPNHNLFVHGYTAGRAVCPKCGSTRMLSNGLRHTQTTSYRRLQCKDCGGHCRGDVKGQNLRAF